MPDSVRVRRGGDILCLLLGAAPKCGEFGVVIEKCVLYGCERFLASRAWCDPWPCLPELALCPPSTGLVARLGARE